VPEEISLDELETWELEPVEACGEAEVTLDKESVPGQVVEVHTPKTRREEEVLGEAGPLVRRGVKPVDMEECYRRAAAGCSLTEVAASLKLPEYVVENNIRAWYGVGWSEYSALATAEMQGDIRVTLMELVRKGNSRLAELYAKKFLGWDIPRRVEMSGRGGGPLEVKALKDDELAKKTESMKHTLTGGPYDNLPAGVTLEECHDQGGVNVVGKGEVRREAEGG